MRYDPKKVEEDLSRILAEATISLIEARLPYTGTDPDARRVVVLAMANNFAGLVGGLLVAEPEEGQLLIENELSAFVERVLERASEIGKAIRKEIEERSSRGISAQERH
jgi:hypothetical protein